MSKRIYYHGTSADNLQSILKYGLIPDSKKLWECSRQEVYLWGVEEIAESEGNEDDLQEWKESAAYQRARESGEIACAVAKDCRIVVVKCILDSNNVEEDTSCENMDGAVTIDMVKKSQIVEIKVSNDISLVRGFLMRSLPDNEYWNRAFTDIENVVIKVLKNIEWYPEYMDDILQWETIHSKQKVVHS